MYTLHVTVQEFPTVHRVHFHFSAVDERGKARPFGSREVWIDSTDIDEDALTTALRVLRRAVTLELRPLR